MKIRMIAVAAMLALCATSSARAADTVRVGKSISSLWTFLVLDVGVEKGVFAKYGIDVDINSLGSGPKLQQALASDSVDVGLGGGSDLVFAVKGAPILGVAAFAGEPRSVVIVVGADSPIQKPKDLKDKLIAMPGGAGSVSDWLLRRMAVAEGLSRDGVRMLAQGSIEANVAALRTHQIDGMVTSLEVGIDLEDRKEGRIAVRLADYAPHFITHAIYARKEFIAQKPEVLARFLKGFFATIQMIKADKAMMSEAAVRLLRENPSVADRTYDAEIGMFSNDGHFDQQGIELLKQSWVEEGVIDKAPSDDQILTRQFVPVTP